MKLIVSANIDAAGAVDIIHLNALIISEFWSGGQSHVRHTDVFSFHDIEVSYSVTNDFVNSGNKLIGFFFGFLPFYSIKLFSLYEA